MKREFNVSLHMNILRNGSCDVEFTWIGEDLEQLFIDVDSIVQAWAKWIDSKRPKRKKTK